MKKKIVGNNFTSLFFIGYLFSLPAFSIFAFLFVLVLDLFTLRNHGYWQRPLCMFSCQA